LKNLLLFAAVCLWACRSFAVPVTIYVAPGGDDHWSGARPSANQQGTDGPMATVSAAIVRSRELRRNATGASPTIVLRRGDYVLERPLDFLPVDSGLVIAARRGEKPVITGETRITGWRQSSVNPNLWQAEIPEARDGKWQFHELFVNGQRRQRSRLPASGYYHTIGGYMKDHPKEVRVKAGEVKPEWAEQRDVELVLYSAWAQTRNQIRSVSAAGDVVTLAGTGFPNQSEKNPRFYIENAPDALQPGAWRLDRRSGTVTYWPEPGEDMRSAVVTAPHVFKLVQIEGTAENPVRGVTFEGLTFAGADWPFDGGSDIDGQAAVEVGGAFEAKWAESCEVRDCVFTRLGGYAIDLGRGCRHNKITGCEMFDLGGGGVRVGESDLNGANASPAYGNRVTDNHIHHIGMVNAPAVGVLVLLSAANDIAHNEINDTFYTAISVGWTWGYGPTPCSGNIVEFNHLHDIGQGMLSDMGGIYTLGLQPGAILRNNLIHDVTILEYGGWGLYTDEGSSGIVLESNVVYRCQSAGFHQHYGETNLTYNNIFALNKEAQLQRTRPETHLGFILTNNIIYFDSGKIFTGDWSGNGYMIDHNIYFDARAADSTSKSESYLKFKEWQGSGHEPGSLFVDPMFVAPEKGDFRLRAGSPALKFGIHPIDLHGVGPRKKFDR
jgi:hypothetical protein